MRWSAISSDKPDVVLLDLVMHGMYGLESCRKSASSIPGPASSSCPRTSRRRRRTWLARRAPPAFINKPFDRMEFSVRSTRRWRERDKWISPPFSRTRSIELINIGFGRAGAALSKLTGHRVVLEVPSITMCPIDEMADRLRLLLDDEIATVHQIFSGRGRRRAIWCSIATAPPS